MCWLSPVVKPPVTKCLLALWIFVRKKKGAVSAATRLPHRRRRPRETGSRLRDLSNERRRTDTRRRLAATVCLVPERHHGTPVLVHPGLSAVAQSSGILIQPWRIAYTTAWVRSLTDSLRRMELMWFFTVCSLIVSA